MIIYSYISERDSEARDQSQRSEAGDQRPEIRGQRSEIRGQRPDAREQTHEAKDLDAFLVKKLKLLERKNAYERESFYSRDRRSMGNFRNLYSNTWNGFHFQVNLKMKELLGYCSSSSTDKHTEIRNQNSKIKIKQIYLCSYIKACR